MHRSTFQPLRSRRFVTATRVVPVASTPLCSAEAATRQTLASIGLVWVSAGATFGRSVPGPAPRRLTALAAA